MWWNSRNVRSVHLCPVGDTKAHWPPSRFQTARLTCCGTWREVTGGLRILSVSGRISRFDRGLAAAPSFVFSTFSSSTVRARSKIAPGSPSGISRRRRACNRHRHLPSNWNRLERFRREAVVGLPAERRRLDDLGRVHEARARTVEEGGAVGQEHAPRAGGGGLGPAGQA